MDIAIVSPSPKPFAVGGIEKLMLGLYEKIDEITDHRVELFKIPTQENNFWSLLESYENFYKLDLNHFDMVITCKYPAWMVNHKNHVIYMAHHLRGLFDTYHFLDLPEKTKKTTYSEINETLEYIRNNENIHLGLEPLFDILNKIKIKESHYPNEFFAFPGPFIREIIHFLDAWALHPNRISRYNSISKTVKSRDNYFPSNVDVQVIYPPTSLKNLSEGDYNYFLVVGRLDGPKRVDMVIDAMKRVKNPDIKLLIAGSGPEENRLRAMAFEDQRIEFIGYINNQKLVELYTDALAVIYIPYDEDYGLVTIEAMQCRKPVITCRDSGGTTEFVIHNKTGLVSNDNPQSLAKQIEILANDKGLAAQLGANAKNFVSEITWDNCVTQLLVQRLETSQRIPKALVSNNKKKIIVLSTYPVFPRKHGGQLRIFNLYYNLSNDYDITIISLTKESQGYEKRIGNLKESCIPMSQKHIEMEWEIEKEVGIPITDIAMCQLSKYTPRYHEAVNRMAEDADILIAAQPYLFHLIINYCGKKQVIYDSQNVEYELKKSMLPNNRKAKKMLEQLYNLEKEACKNSDVVYVCSNEDLNKMTDLYNISSDKMVLIPNGVDLSSNEFVSVKQRQENKIKYGLANERIVVFIGSWHKPNLEAVEEIIKFAPKLPEIYFIIMGGQCLAFKDRKLPENMVLAGIVEEKLKSHIYSIADVAVNPMINGSGTNLKIAEYFSNGLPVISTKVGVRGYPVENKKHLIVTDIKDFPDNIEMLLAEKELVKNLSTNSKKIAEEFSWINISSKLKNTFYI